MGLSSEEMRERIERAVFDEVDKLGSAINREGQMISLSVAMQLLQMKLAEEDGGSAMRGSMFGLPVGSLPEPQVPRHTHDEEGNVVLKATS